MSQFLCSSNHSECEIEEATRTAGGRGERAAGSVLRGALRVSAAAAYRVAASAELELLSIQVHSVVQFPFGPLHDST